MKNDVLGWIYKLDGPRASNRGLNFTASLQFDGFDAKKASCVSCLIFPLNLFIPGRCNAASWISIDVLKFWYTNDVVVLFTRCFQNIISIPSSAKTND